MYSVTFPVFVIWFLVANVITADKTCVQRSYNDSSFVCVCNSTYCDTIEKVKKLPSSNFIVYCSSMDGLRFKKKTGRFRTPKNHKTKSWWSYVKSVFDISKFINFSHQSNVVVKVDRNVKYQQIIGFGGGFTDSTGINLLKMSEGTRNKILEAYFGEDGIEYNLCRVPIGGTDFSTHAYAYNMEPKNDLKLSNFSLTTEDFKYKIPIIRRAQKISSDDLFLIASAWSPPDWMKTNNKPTGPSQLYLKYYQTWADYHIKFLEEYDKNKIKFWGITTGNEPSTGIITIVKINSLGWLPVNQAHWIADNFGPTLKRSPYKDLKIIALDDYRSSLFWWLDIIANNSKAFEYVDGVGTHWYIDDILHYGSIKDDTHDLYPNLFKLNTEACVGFEFWLNEQILFGSWENGEKYISSIINNMNNWYSGWIEWNLVLDMNGGPNMYGNFMNAPILVLPETDEFIKQPMFYIICHLTKFIPRNSIKIMTNTNSNEILNIAFLRPDGGITVILYNQTKNQINITIEEKEKGIIDLTIPRKSIISLVYW